MSTLHVQLVTPERTVLNLELLSLSCPTSMGQITILPGHIPLVANLTSGELIAHEKGSETPIHVAGGFIQVQPGNTVVILADAAEHIHEIDEQRALEAQKKAQETLRQSDISEEEYTLAATSLQRSLSRLNIVRKHSHRRTAPITSQGVREE